MLVVAYLSGDAARVSIQIVWIRCLSGEESWARDRAKAYCSPEIRKNRYRRTTSLWGPTLVSWEESRLEVKREGNWWVNQRSAKKTNESQDPNTHHTWYIHRLVRSLTQSRSLEAYLIVFERCATQSSVCAWSLDMPRLAKMCDGCVRLNSMFRLRMGSYTWRRLEYDGIKGDGAYCS